MTQIIQETTDEGESTERAFDSITTQIENFVTIFDQLINSYYEIATKNKSIVEDFSGVEVIGKDILSQMSSISSTIDDNISHLNEIESCNVEIRDIVIRNNTEAVNLGQSQAPIYKNLVENSKMIEAVR